VTAKRSNGAPLISRPDLLTAVISALLKVFAE
jgi:hypothetical protein